MTIYLDSNFCCHLTNDGTMREIEIDDFNEKCKTYVEGYRFIPSGESWTAPDGRVFYGCIYFPWVNHDSLLQAQAQYELDMASMSDMQQALNILGVTE